MIRMLTDTCYNNKAYKSGEEYRVDKITAERWVKNGIAVESYAPTDFNTMTDDQLVEYANQKGVDISRLTSRKSIIARLEKAEGAE